MSSKEKGIKLKFHSDKEEEFKKESDSQSLMRRKTFKKKSADKQFQVNDEPLIDSI